MKFYPVAAMIFALSFCHPLGTQPNHPRPTLPAQGFEDCPLVFAQVQIIRLAAAIVADSEQIIGANAKMIRYLLEECRRRIDCAVFVFADLCRGYSSASPQFTLRPPAFFS
jgi:hypothetical protein